MVSWVSPWCWAIWLLLQDLPLGWCYVCPLLRRVHKVVLADVAIFACYAASFRRLREKRRLPGNVRAKCILFELRMARSSPHASVSGRNRAISDTWCANLAREASFSRRGPRDHAWGEDLARVARASPFRWAGYELVSCEKAQIPGRSAKSRLRVASFWVPCRLAEDRRRDRVRL